MARDKAKSFWDTDWGVEFMLDTDLYQKFAFTGMSFQGFRKMLRCLRVPTLHMGKVRLVRVQSFQLALVAVSRVGQLDFLSPGCDTLNRWREEERDRGTKELDIGRFKKEWKEVVLDLLYSRAKGSDKV